MWIKAGSKAERGLPANWEAIRAAVLRRDRYLCRCSECQTNGRVRTASEVDHVVPRAEGIRRGWTLAQINAMIVAASMTRPPTVDVRRNRPASRMASRIGRAHV